MIDLKELLPEGKPFSAMTVCVLWHATGDSMHMPLLGSLSVSRSQPPHVDACVYMHVCVLHMHVHHMLNKSAAALRQNWL